MSTTVEVGELESAALKRKARLAELKAKKARTEKSVSPNEGQEQDLALPKPTFRSYDPLNEDLKNSVLPVTDPGEITDKVKEELDNQNQGVEIDQLDFTALAPRKPDWDLKRDIAPKLEKLERKKQRAIAELIRERLQKEDLANAVNAGASAARQTATEED